MLIDALRIPFSCTWADFTLNILNRLYSRFVQIHSLNYINILGISIANTSTEWQTQNKTSNCRNWFLLKLAISKRSIRAKTRVGQILLNLRRLWESSCSKIVRTTEMNHEILERYLGSKTGNQSHDKYVEKINANSTHKHLKSKIIQNTCISRNDSARSRYSIRKRSIFPLKSLLFFVETRNRLVVVVVVVIRNKEKYCHFIKS